MGFGLGSIGKALGVAGSALNLGTSIAGLSQEGLEPSQRNVTNAIRIRVRDAKAAGVHPLFALGANVGGPVMPATGSGVGDAMSQLGGEIDRVGTAATAKAERALAAKEAASRMRVNETQAQLNEARSRTLIQEMMNNPGILNTITKEQLPKGYIRNPETKRLAMWQDPQGKWHRVNPNQAPQNVLEEEFGEVSEIQGILRALKGIPSYGGALDWPSLDDLRMMLTK